MTMQSGGAISMLQAMSECQVGQQQFDAASSQLSRLAGVGQGAQYAWSYWYGKSFGTVLTEGWTQYFGTNMSGSTGSANFGRSLELWRGGAFWGTSGGDNTAGVGGWPGGLVNGFNIDGFYRTTNQLVTVMALNCSLDGVRFVSSVGDNFTLTNDISISVAMGAGLWTFYGGGNGTPNPPYPQSRQMVLNLYGPANRPQPPNGYVNGVAPSTGSGSSGTRHSTSHHCFVAGSMVLMANGSWKEVEKVQAGDRVMGPSGPVGVERLHVATVGTERSLLSFKEDAGHIWTSDHPHWTRQGDQQGWWSGQPDYLREAMAIALIPGVNPRSILTGDAEFAHMDGFLKRTPVQYSADPNTKVYVPVVEGSPIIVNGYLTGGFIDEKAYDYNKLDWNQFLNKHA